MQPHKRMTEDSMSLEVNDRFFQSQSSSNPQFSQYNPESNYQPKEGISQLVELSHHNHKYSQQMSVRQKKSSLLKKQNTDFESKESFQSDDKQKGQQKQSKGGKKNPTSQKKKHNSKNYRERKKVYIQKLQQQHRYYKMRTAELQQKVILLQRQICQLKYDHDNHYVILCFMKKSGYEKQYCKDLQFLKSTVSENKLSPAQVIQVAIKLREKYGPAGHDRKMILNYYMSEYINSTMGDFQKYIFNSVLKKSGPFGESRSVLDEKINNVLRLNEAQRLNLTKNVFPDLYPLAVSYSNCCKNIYKDYVSLLQEANKFHKMMEKGLNYTALPQLTRLVIWFEQNKTMPEVRRLKQEWIRIFSGQMQPQQCFG